MRNSSPPARVVTKNDLTTQISDQAGLAHATVIQIVQLLIKNVTNHLANGNGVTLRNFGTFEVKLNQARIGRNPSKPEQMVNIPPRAAVKFTPGKVLRNQVLELTPETAAGRKDD